MREITIVTVYVILSLATVDSSQAERLFVDTCRQGECDKQWLISMVPMQNGRIVVRVRTEYYNNSDEPAAGPDISTIIVACNPADPYVEYANGNKVLEVDPNEQNHATEEPDNLWLAVCKGQYPN